MRVVQQSLAAKGSLKDIQILVNQHPELFNQRISDLLNHQEQIQWLSPLQRDDYAEYRDQAFLDRVGLPQLKEKLSLFWPKSGPQWDALGKSDDKVFLVEAKANLVELKSPPCGAKAESSVRKIHHSLELTKQYIADQPITAPWSLKYYQYTNRLAHLYFLRQEGIDAYLIFVYFIGDESVSGPKQESEWGPAIMEMKSVLGLPKIHKLSPYILDVFIDVHEITNSVQPTCND